MNEQHTNARKVLYILLAIVIAAVIWLYVDEFGNNGTARTKQVTIDEIPITFVGESELTDRGLMLMEDQTSDYAALTVEGGRRTVAHLDREDITVTVDISDISKAGKQLVKCQVSFSDKRFSEDMITEYSIDDRISAYAFVNIKELSSKTIDIHCELSGQVADGYFAGEPQIEQDTLEIRGQAEDLKAVSYAKVVLDIGDGATETVSKALEFQYYSASGKLLDATNIRPEVETLQVTLPVYVTKELELVVNFKEADGARADNLTYEISPRTIVVSGDAATLNSISTIVLGELDLLDLLGSETSSHTYPIILPDGCQNLSGVTRATLDIGFTDMASASISAGLFAYNTPAGKHVQILTQEMTVRIFGISEDVAAVTSENISVTADLSKYSSASGTYTVPAAIEVVSTGDIGVSGTYHVQVIIRDEAEEPEEEGTDSPVTPEAENPEEETQE